MKVIHEAKETHKLNIDAVAKLINWRAQNKNKLWKQYFQVDINFQSFNSFH